MNVQKRNGTIINFQKNKIVSAIESAMDDTLIGATEGLGEYIAEQIFEELSTHTQPIKMDTIQDMVEMALMHSNRKDVAKAYILYRDKKNQERVSTTPKGILTEEFLSQYKHKQPIPSQLGQFVYYRTYSRWLPEKNRRESWWETVRRAVEYNCSLLPTTKEEAEALFDNVFHLRIFLSGRTLWTGGTEVSKKFPLSNFNCAGVVVDDFEAFKDLFYLLMIGAGCGVRVLPEDVEKLPKIRSDVEIIHMAYQPVKERNEHTSLVFTKDMAKIIVGDSREGWVQVIEYFFRLLWSKEYRGIKTIVMDYNHIRRKGERLKTFGGTASGHKSLQNMFVKIGNVINRISAREKDSWVKLRALDCLDICNIIGENVVVGGIRRTSEIGLISPDDEESINAKENLYSHNEGRWEINQDIIHRQMSNNSIYYEEKPTREQLHSHLEKIRYNGEPGFINAEAARKRREDFAIANPCFTGDMKLLTVDGYKRFDELDGKETKILNKNGELTRGKVWCSGEKAVVKITTKLGDEIVCTPDHVFATSRLGDETQAINLLNKNIFRLDRHYIPTSKNPFRDFHSQYVPVQVISVEPYGKAKVYDFSEPHTNWGWVEGYLVHNCGEILLKDKQCCNLTSLNVAAFVKNGLDKEYLLAAQKLSARAGYRMTNVELELPKWDKAQKDDRLTGCSLMGWQDMVNLCEMDKEEQEELLFELKKVAIDAVDQYAEMTGGKPSRLITTVKPEGTQSQLPGVSPGIHYPHSEYFIRRVRISAHDPLCRVAEELGWPVFPEVGQTEENCMIKVIEFPAKAPKGRTKYDVTAIEQLENYKMFMHHYVMHNASITVSVKKDEWEKVEEWVWDNWDDVVAISFLPLDNSFYQMMPYEQISAEEYNRRLTEMRPFLPSLLSKYEYVEDVIEDPECGNGCPVR